MRKDHIRDYTVFVFHFYALSGEPNEQEIEKLKSALTTAAVLDLAAAEKTMRQIDSDTSAAVRAVYFREPKRDFRKREIEQRVIKFCMENHIDRSNVYRRLKAARKICARNRGLNF